ncbi:methyltransferase domain-containing protein [Nioella aestuarii]|uniref:methyltransferase domain-containing protein n=1 Tax=Nioella aestuarii TaxID=1662864 RepID=UPI003D7FFACB
MSRGLGERIVAQNKNFDITAAAAADYQNKAVPAMFEPLARATMAKIDLPEGGHVIDIACGTGVAARIIAEHLPGTGHIVGTDISEAMVAVAMRSEPSHSRHRFTWFASDVVDMPCDGETFDIAFVQQGLQFFPDKPAALAEIARVLKPGGVFYVTCWAEISPFNGSIADALEAAGEADAAGKARAPFSFRDGDMIATLLGEAGFAVERRDTVELFRRFGNPKDQVMSLPAGKDIVALGETRAETVFWDIERRLSPYLSDEGYAVPQKAHLFGARRL